MNLRVQWLHTPAALHEHTQALETLASQALEPNVFHEPWLLLPALDAFAGPDLRLALIWHPDGSLAGLFPFQWHPRRAHVPAHLSLWQHRYSFLSTPLLHHHAPQATLTALLTQIEHGHAPARCLRLSPITADGSCAQALAQALHTRPGWSQHRDLSQRALLTLTAHTPPSPALSARHRKELRRQWKRLSQHGPLHVRALHADQDPAPWLHAFLRLEASGWKGRAGTALQQSSADAAFFLRIATQAHQRQRLHLLALEYNGQPIAMQCNLRAGEGAFAFKVAFDETHAAASPGVQLELHAMQHLAHLPGLAWVDSCASPQHALMNRLWPHRRHLADHWLAHGHLHARTWITYLRLRRRLGRALHTR